MTLLNIIGEFLYKIFKPYLDDEFNPELVTWVSWFNCIFIITGCLVLVISLLIEYYIRYKNDDLDDDD